ncbi:hypothetical protein L209DRAFT_456274 [Thermothelomyces heterothallicus CBS 203.75]
MLCSLISSKIITVGSLGVLGSVPLRIHVFILEKRAQTSASRCLLDTLLFAPLSPRHVVKACQCCCSHRPAPAEQCGTQLRISSGGNRLFICKVLN